MERGRFRWEGVRFGWSGGVLGDNSIKNKHVNAMVLQLNKV